MPCLNNGTCIDNLDTPLGYRCECLNDSSGVTYGDNCEIASACASSPCQYGGTCVVRQDGGYQCECVENYGGIFCEEYTGPLTTIEDKPTREKTIPTGPTATSKFDQLPWQFTYHTPQFMLEPRHREWPNNNPKHGFSIAFAECKVFPYPADHDYYRF